MKPIENGTRVVHLTTNGIGIVREFVKSPFGWKYKIEWLDTPGHLGLVDAHDVMAETETSAGHIAHGGEQP